MTSWFKLFKCTSKTGNDCINRVGSTVGFFAFLYHLIRYVMISLPIVLMAVMVAAVLVVSGEFPS
jgi:hypothetical protein